MIYTSRQELSPQRTAHTDTRSQLETFSARLGTGREKASPLAATYCHLPTRRRDRRYAGYRRQSFQRKEHLRYPHIHHNLSTSKYMPIYCLYIAYIYLVSWLGIYVLGDYIPP